MNGVFENHIDQIIRLIKQRGRAWRSIFLLDQYGYSDVTMDTLQKIFSTLPNAEVILTISIDFMTRYMTDSAQFSQLLQRLGITYDLTNLPEEKAHKRWRYAIQHKLIDDFKK